MNCNIIMMELKSDLCFSAVHTPRFRVLTFFQGAFSSFSSNLHWFSNSYLYTYVCVYVSPVCE